MFGLITGSVTVLGAVAAATRYITESHYKAERTILEARTKDLQIALEKSAGEFQRKNDEDRERFQAIIGDLEARNKDLLSAISVTRRVGSAALSRKMEIDDELSSVMTSVGAEKGSIYIPLSRGLSSEPVGLVFLSIQPAGRQAASLKRKIIPMQSIAGRCFRTGEASATQASADPQHFKAADKISGSRIQDMLNSPLRHRGEVIGVLQLMNKKGADQFSADDLPLVESFTASLAQHVSEFARLPENYEILGVTQEQKAQAATVVFCDLTRSSLLFQELSIGVAIQHLNEYLEKVTDVGMRYGATVDKYIGDGVLLRFNVPRRVKNHALKAVSAALEMKDAFEQLKLEWSTMGEPLDAMSIRISVAYGEVYEAAVGHPQYQYLTVFGHSVNIAAALCAAADRDRSVIVLDERLYKELAGSIVAERLPKERLGKAASYIESVYELRGIISGLGAGSAE